MAGNHAALGMARLREAPLPGTRRPELAKLIPGSVQESDERDLLCSRAGDNVKVHDELMDIKGSLKVVNEDRLEQWTPVMKANFPLAAAESEEGSRVAEPHHAQDEAETYPRRVHRETSWRRSSRRPQIWAWAAI
ncbi:MAG: hypothetical protein IPP91_20305 [Betaproteobacteria bacterium]|nr:hypothetical protein [Betaproteobacteria bacterium]